ADRLLSPASELLRHPNVVNTGSDADVGRTPDGPQGPGAGPGRPARPSPAKGPGAHTGTCAGSSGQSSVRSSPVSLAITSVGSIVATLKTFLIIGLIAMAVIIIVWLVARRPRSAVRRD